MTGGSAFQAAESFRQILSHGPYERINKLLSIVGRESSALLTFLTNEAILSSRGELQLPSFFTASHSSYAQYSFWRIIQLLEEKPLWYSHVETLSIKGHNREEDFRIPPGIDQLPALRNLQLSSVGLSLFPEELLSLRKLKSLDLSENQIHEIPRGIGSLRQLVYFNLADNELKTLPEQMKVLRKLQILNLSGNEISHLGFPLSGMRQMKNLDLSGNCLACLPAGLESLNQLESIQLAYNDLSAEDEALWESGGFASISAYQMHFSF